ncbi:virulence RhuM family protein [Desulfoprunum benzoelyticum]|uniref:Toxin Fic n=1 Tax=Desulfoprunum benzoelyticum TaxID=1506996 RepID=A0A840USE0_9BACT|nr:RhuM family protein [Desulfoprunum benzoelyticum]MBB5348565.1 hypothetical protein [Desulfoprunum benzoelyticum]MBM9529825.1 virulence RhuM family protein [Desulfoprunum benzoelyticum]
MKKDKAKEIQKPHKKETAMVRSSAAEYLTFVAAGGGSEASVEMRYEDENIWLTQKMMATLYDVSVPAINQHLKRIFADNELTREATVKQYLIVQTEGNREVRCEVEHYNLQATIAVGFKIENERAVQFRKWANQIVKDYTIQGWTMDVERLKRGGNLTHWEGAPHGKIHRYDGAIAKNYLSEFELAQMQRIVSAYLDMAELQAMRKIPMTMEDWEKRLAGFLKLWDREILQDAGTVSAELAKTQAASEYEKYRIVQDRLFESDFDRMVKQIESAGDEKPEEE